MITVHDLIAFQIPVYHPTADQWFNYRSATRSSAAAVDGCVAPSKDTARQIGLERLSIDEQRVFVVVEGVDHLRGDEPEREPAELLARGFAGQPFMLVLGTNYTHKNRDLAIRVAHQAGRRGFGLALVMAPPRCVPFRLLPDGRVDRMVPRGSCVRPSRTSHQRSATGYYATLNSCSIQVGLKASGSSPTKRRRSEPQRWSCPSGLSRNGWPDCRWRRRIGR